MCLWLLRGREVSAKVIYAKQLSHLVLRTCLASSLSPSSLRRWPALWRSVGQVSRSSLPEVCHALPSQPCEPSPQLSPPLPLSLSVSRAHSPNLPPTHSVMSSHSSLPGVC